jgi:hypothetical protein
LVTEPASTSACVSEYVAVHVVAASGATLVVGHEMADKLPVPENPSSTIARPVAVTFPVFVTKNEYVTVSPALLTVVGLADLVSVSAGVWVAVTVAVDGAETSGLPETGVPDAVAVSEMLPLSRSA